MAEIEKVWNPNSLGYQAIVNDPEGYESYVNDYANQGVNISRSNTYAPPIMTTQGPNINNYLSRGVNTLDWLTFGGSIVGDLLRGASQDYWNKRYYDTLKQQWSREDSAYQRKVADLKAAGLNPVLAVSGSGASSSAPSHVSSGYTGYSADSPGASAVQQAQLANIRLQNQSIAQDIAYKKALTDRARSSITGIEISNALGRMDLDWATTNKILNALGRSAQLVGSGVSVAKAFKR